MQEIQKRSENIYKFLANHERRTIDRFKTEATSIVSPEVVQHIKLLSEVSVPDVAVNNTNYFLKLPPEREFTRYTTDIIIFFFIYKYNVYNVSVIYFSVILVVMSYLNSKSLWQASKVCKQWERLIRCNTPQKTWYKLTKKWWPLFILTSPVRDWYDVNDAL